MHRLLLTLALTAGGCGLDPVDFGDKECPCGPGLVCDEAANRCVTTLSDAGPSCDPLVTATDFVAAWATPNVIRWEWTPSGEAGSLARYEVHIAPTVEELGTPSARVVGPDENPELGAYVLLGTGSGDEVVDHSMTFEHAPGEDYVAQLVAIDRRACEFRSSVAAIRTTAQGQPLPLFGADSTEEGSSPTDGARLVEGDGGHLLYVPTDDPVCMTAVCSQNIKWSNMDVDATDISPGEFMNFGYIEAVVANDTDNVSYFSRLWLQLSDGRIFRLEPFTYRPSPEYRTYQVPLRALEDIANGGARLTQQDLQDFRIFEVNVGGQWSQTSADGPGAVRIRSVRIGY